MPAESEVRQGGLLSFKSPLGKLIDYEKITWPFGGLSK